MTGPVTRPVKGQKLKEFISRLKSLRQNRSSVEETSKFDAVKKVKLKSSDVPTFSWETDDQKAEFKTKCKIELDPSGRSASLHTPIIRIKSEEIETIVEPVQFEFVDFGEPVINEEHKLNKENNTRSKRDSCRRTSEKNITTQSKRIRKPKICHCSDCTNTFSLKHNSKVCYKSPINDKSANVKEVFIHACTECDKVFSSNQGLKGHTLSVHGKLKPYKCLECTYVSSRKSSVYTHTKTQHGKPFKCLECHFSCSIKETLSDHTKLAHRKLKPFRCAECMCAFFTKTSLSIHIKLVHEKLEPFKCLECEYVSSSKANLSVHIWSVHEKTALKNRKMRSWKYPWGKDYRKTIFKDIF